MDEMRIETRRDERRRGATGSEAMSRLLWYGLLVVWDLASAGTIDSASGIYNTGWETVVITLAAPPEVTLDAGLGTSGPERVGVEG